MLPFSFVTAVVLTVSQTSPLDITNVRFTHGPLGATRATAKFLPGDSVALAYDIQGLKFDDSGKASYSIAMEFATAKGEVKLKQEPRKTQALNYLGGNSLPGLALLNLNPDQTPGEYSLKITVTDESSSSSKTMTQKIEVLPEQFGVVQLGLSSDPDGGIPASPLAVVGESVFFNFAASGAGRDKTKKQPDLRVELRILDEQGKDTLTQPLKGQANQGIPDSMKLIQMQFAISLNRAGKYTLALKATDLVNNKSVDVSLPLTVMLPK